MGPVAKCWSLGLGTLLLTVFTAPVLAAEPKSSAEGSDAAAASAAEPGGKGEAGSEGRDKDGEPSKGAKPRAGDDGAGGKPKAPGGDEAAAGAKSPAASGAAQAGAKGAAEDAKKDEDSGWLAGHRGNFAFGSYGRVIAATDGSGRPGRDADIVAHGSRLDYNNYVELELRREDYWAPVDASTKIVATLALANSIFHYSGDFDTSIAVRNMYVETQDLGAKGLNMWAGSRMLRGDDIYLLDFWPLDNLNTVGVGLRYGFCGESAPAQAKGSEGTADDGPDAKNAAAKQGEAATKSAATAAPPAAPPPPWCTAISGHVGLGQPNNPFYQQLVERPEPLNQFGQATVAILDRQRWIGSLRGEQIVRFGGDAGMKFVAYGEVHGVPAAQRETEQANVYEDVPGETGFVIGAQVGAFTGERDGFVNLFVRYAGGLAAYGEFAMPTGLSTDRTATGAHELLVALGGNYEIGPVALTLGAYVRSFRNANKLLDFEDVDEGIILFRPHLFVCKWAGVALEGSYQLQQRGVVTTGLDDPAHSLDTTPLTAHVGRIGVIPFISPAGQGAFKRPWIYLTYLATFRDAAARELYPVTDVFRMRSIDHYVGLGAEWWFSSSSYGGQ